MMFADFIDVDWFGRPLHYHVWDELAPSSKQRGTEVAKATKSP